MSVSNPNEQHEDVSTLGIMMKYMERTIRLEEERKKDRQELQEQISSVRTETAEMVDNRLGTLKERFDNLDAKLEEMSKPKEQPAAASGNPSEIPTQTEVDQSLGSGKETQLSSPPTEIHPPKVPKGHRGRRKYRREHGSQGK